MHSVQAHESDRTCYLRIDPPALPLAAIVTVTTPVCESKLDVTAWTGVGGMACPEHTPAEPTTDRCVLTVAREGKRDFAEVVKSWAAVRCL